eukprot:GCRY01000772.1.p1 GENE.GCRY01000772.1~~GCRY01000772.1.p1  ORF type:complete len:289 (+),score=50.57 GCRY01000772.1:184-1050(+)
MAKKQQPFVHQLIAGAVAGTSEIIVMYPTDVLKTRFQLATTYQSLGNTIKNMAKEEGWGIFYRGIFAPILAEAPKRAVKFGCNARYQNWLRKPDGSLTFERLWAAGALAGATEAFINTPFEVVKVRMQSLEGKALYNSVFDATWKMLSNEGPMSLYKGFEPQIMRNSIWAGFYFSVGAFSKKHLLWQPKDSRSGMARDFLAGMIGGMVATSFSTPMDVIKSRLQDVSIGSGSQWCLPRLVQTYRAEGLRSLYRGYGMRLVRLGPGGGIMLVAFQVVSDFLANSSKKKD